MKNHIVIASPERAKQSLTRILAIGSIALGLSACGDDITEINANVGAVKTSDDLPECTEDIAGQTAFIKETHEFLGCDGKEWQTLSANTVSVGDNVCTSTSLSDGTGFEIFCNGASIGTVKNGKDGTDGKDGANGKDGEPGAAGKDGADGQKGDTGAKGDKGDDGAPGTNGTNGTNGKDGAPGADGTGCRILESTELTATIACGSETFTMDLTGYVDIPEECDPSDEGCAVQMDDVELSGVSQKGPFVSGTDVTAYELENGKSLKQTGKTFGGKIENKDGSFNIRTVKLKSSYAYLVADGFYRNEVTGKTSATTIKLRALTNLDGRSMANINLVTHLEYDRVQRLVTKDNKSVIEAKRAAEKSLFASFNIDNTGFKGFAEDLNIFKEGDGNAALLAVSAMLQGDRSEAELTALLASLSVDLGDNGVWDDSLQRAKIADWAMKADIEGRLATIRANVEGWGLSTSKAPAFEGHVTNFWMTELGVGECSSDNDGKLFATKNKFSAYYAKSDSAFTEGDSSLVRLICDASGENPAWRFATDIEKDTAALSAELLEGAATTGSINTGRVYVKEGNWRRGTQLDLDLAKSCVANIKKHTTYSAVSTDTTWYICVDDGSKLDGYTVPTSWRKATETEADTAQFGIPESAADSIKVGHVNKGRYFVYDAGEWRRGTENDRLLEKACRADMVGKVYKIKNQFYTCTDEKKILPDGFEIVTTWRVSTADEADNYFTENPEQDGAVKQGDMDKARIYVYEGEWRRGTALDLTLGVGCLAANEGTVFKTASNKYYTCTAEKQTVDGVLVNNTWRESTPDEADNYFTTGGTAGQVKRGDMDSTRIYVYDDGKWRRGTSLDWMLGEGCTLDKKGTVKKQDNKYYTCTTESALENGATVNNTWRESTPDEADNYFTGNGTAGQVKRGDMDSTRIYVFEGDKWRRGTSLDWMLGEGCTLDKKGTIKKQDNRYYTCTEESVLENGATVNNTWRLSKAFEADIYGWSNPSSGADSVRTGNVDASHYYVFEDGVWRLGTSLDSDEGLGPCLTSKLNQLGQRKNVSGAVGKYICVNDEVIIDGVRILTSWRKASNYEMDTYPLSSSLSTGSYHEGSVNTDLHYVKDSTGWRPATDMENTVRKACTYVQKNNVKATTAGTWYKCTNEIGTTIDGFIVAYTWRTATNIEKDTVGWGTYGYETGEFKTGNVNKNLVYVFENNAWRHGTTLDLTLGMACIPSRKNTFKEFSSVEWYKCVGDTTVSYEESNWTSVWRRATDLELDMKYWNEHSTEDGTLLKGPFTGMIRVWDNGSLREPNEVELGWNKGCVKAKYGKTDTLSNGLVYTCSSTGWSKTGTFSDCSDIDANWNCKIYKGVQIGTQIWMAENLNHKTKNSFCYNDKESNCTKYGRLYRWSAAMDSIGTWPNPQCKCGYETTCVVVPPHRGVCPAGWHMPVVKEFEILIATVGGIQKLRSTTGWDNSSVSGTDEYSFTALPAGYLEDYSNDGYGFYYEEGDAARFLTASEKDQYSAYHYKIRNGSYSGEFLGGPKNKAYSVRCIKDN